MTREPCAGLVNCWGGGGPKKPQAQDAGGAPTGGKPRLCLPEQGPGQVEETGARALGSAPPGACGGEGLDKAPLAVLLGVGAQALWVGPPSSGPHPCPLHRRGLLTGLHSGNQP